LDQNDGPRCNAAPLTVNQGGGPVGDAYALAEIDAFGKTNLAAFDAEQGEFWFELMPVERHLYLRRQPKFWMRCAKSGVRPRH
jgi:hypothetical protein